MKRTPKGHGSNAPNRLMMFVERIERLEDEKREITAAITDVKKEAKAAGFDPRVITQMLRERRMSDEEREEWQALCDMYRAALGMLGGTPLGEAARRRFAGETRPTPPPGGDAKPGGGGEGPDAPDAVQTPGELSGEPPIGPEAIAAARLAGAVAFTAKIKITDNPYPFADPRRAAWDEGWCKEAGSDGMDLPEAWRRAKPPKGDGKGDGKGGTA